MTCVCTCVCVCVCVCVFVDSVFESPMRVPSLEGGEVEERQNAEDRKFSAVTMGEVCVLCESVGGGRGRWRGGVSDVSV